MEEEVYLDEEILQKRREKLKEQYCTLETGIYIEGQIKEFERKEVLDSLFVLIPTTFTLMPDELAEVKYPFVFRPACILTNETLTVNLNFNEFPNALGETTLLQATENMKEILENEQSVFDFGEVIALKGIEGYYFDFRQNVMDGELYHMIANINLEDHLYQCTFNCLFSNQLDWKSAVVQMWESAKYHKEDKR